MEDLNLKVQTPKPAVEKNTAAVGETRIPNTQNMIEIIRVPQHELCE